MTNNLLTYQTRFNHYANQHLPRGENHLGQVYKAIHYAFSAGGKRLRPALVYAMAESLGLPLKAVDPLALAIECIHTYSLIHDDLPSMDNDDLRRGQPACHKKFNEGTAILAGDALNTLAFEILAKQEAPSDSIKIRQIAHLANCAGLNGMVGGQDTDLYCENTKTTITQTILSQLHQNKTARLIEASLLLPYLMNQTTSGDKEKVLSSAALALGLVYQIQDDILDATQPSEVLGKPSGSDVNNNKTTYVTLLGVSAAQQAAKAQADQVEEKLTLFFDDFPVGKHYQKTPLAQIIAHILVRKY